MSNKVGRITLAVALIGAGAVLIYDNLTGTALSWSLFQLWPALLILLGLEWIIASAAGGQQQVQADSGAIVLLIIGLVVMGALSTTSRAARSVNWTVTPRVAPSAFGTSISSDEITSTYDPAVDALRHLIISGGPAAVVVQPGERLRLELAVKAFGRSHAEAEENARQARLDVEPGRTTEVGVVLPSGISYGMVTIRVTAPPEAQLTLSTSSGYIEVIDRRAGVTATTSSGTIKAESIRGLVDLRASSGAITARQVTGSAGAITSSGTIRLEQVSGDVEASATSGSVYVVDAGGKVSAHTSSGTVAVDALSLGGDYDLGAVSGSVRLSIPQNADVMIDARTASSSVSGPPWLRYGEGRGSATGSRGDADHKLTIRTSSGSIFIAER